MATSFSILDINLFCNDTQDPIIIGLGSQMTLYWGIVIFGFYCVRINLSISGEDNEAGIPISVTTLTYNYCPSYNESVWRAEGFYNGDWKLGVGLASANSISLRI